MVMLNDYGIWNQNTSKDYANDKIKVEMKGINKFYFPNHSDNGRGFPK